MNQQQPIHRRRLTRAEIRRRRRNRAIRRIAGLTLVVCVAVGTGALRRESRKDTPPTATQTTRVSPAMRRMAPGAPPVVRPAACRRLR